MGFLLDADTLIQAKNTYYAFDLCPGFWAFLERERAAGAMLSIHRVRLELEAGNDELAAWARTQGDAFFIGETAATATSMEQVSQWVQAGNFTDEAKRTFFGGADPFLIAQALADGHTVVSHEVHVEGQRNKVKIPTVCRGLGVPCELTFNALRQRGAVLLEIALPGSAVDRPTIPGSPAQARMRAFVGSYGARNDTLAGNRSVAISTS